MATYNGDFNLGDQLRSIARQSRPPDEVVVCDDGSTDGTWDTVRAWAETAPFAVRIERNAERLGATRNFARAIGLCTGDLIFTADQDDVWLPNKVEREADLLERAPDVGLVFTDAEVVDSELRPLGYRMWRTVRFRGREQGEVRGGRAINVLLRRNVVTGATMAFRARYRDLLLPIPANPLHVHDEWIAFLIAATGSIDFIARPTILYRQHGANALGAHPPTGPGMLARALGENTRRVWRERQGARLAWCRELRGRLTSLAGVRPPHPGVLEALDGKIAHLERRLRLPPGRLARVPQVTLDTLALRYHRYSIGVWGAAQDLLAWDDG